MHVIKITILQLWSICRFQLLILEIHCQRTTELILHFSLKIEEEAGAFGYRSSVIRTFS